jgi:hypothetical protein
MSWGVRSPGDVGIRIQHGGVQRLRGVHWNHDQQEVQMSSTAEVVQAAQEMVSANKYLVLATATAGATPWVTPVYFAHAGLRKLANGQSPCQVADKVAKQVAIGQPPWQVTGGLIAPGLSSNKLT